MQAGELMALKPPAGSVTSSMWVLPDSSSANVHLWPHLNSVLASEYITRVAQVRVRLAEIAAFESVAEA